MAPVHVRVSDLFPCLFIRVIQVQLWFAHNSKVDFQVWPHLRYLFKFRQVVDWVKCNVFLQLFWIDIQKKIDIIVSSKELKQTAVNKLWTLSISIHCRVVIHLAGYSSALCLFASGRCKLQSCGEQTVSFFSESDSSRMRLVRGPLSCCLSLGPCWGGGCGQRLPDRLAQHKPCDPFFFFFLILINLFGAACICRVFFLGLALCREKDFV